MTTHQPSGLYGGSTRSRATTSVGHLLPSQIATAATGVVFAAAGIAGFVVTGFERFAEPDSGGMLLGFHVNPLHNLVHLLFGVFGLIAWRTVRSSLGYAITMIVAYGAVLIAGLFAIGQEWNILAIDQADNWLHLAFVVVGALIAIEAGRELRNETTMSRTTTTAAPTTAARR